MTILRDPSRAATIDVYGPGSPVGVRLDSESGLLRAIVRRDDPAHETPVSIGLVLVTGGVETRGPVGGLIYTGTERTRLDDLTGAHMTLNDEGDAVRCIATARRGVWSIDLDYRLGSAQPHLAFGFTLRRASDGAGEPLRDVELTITLPLGDASDWQLNAPGNQLRADVPADALSTPARIFTAGDVFGSPGLIALSRRATRRTTVLWPVCTTEIGELDVEVEDDCANVTLKTGLAGRMPAESGGMSWRAVYLDSIAAPWPEVRSDLSAWHRRLGLEVPGDTPVWMRRAHIYEAHVGFSVFHEGRRYERYQTIDDLRADLPRIQQLGFDVVQLMPRHPYPSYNVHDYADVTTTFGEEDALRELVRECHSRGMRVLLDIILHGVVDKEVVDQTVAAVRAGPLAQELGNGTIDYLSRTAEDIAWSRHIVEYGPHWRDGSPARHALPYEHPEWFMRDSSGTIIGRYTKAFDMGHPGWRRYALDACVELVERLGVDGYRVDAPTYNDFPTWAPGREARASYVAMAALGFLGDLRTRLRSLRDDVVVYTEPTGGLFRAVADATYNYDEHWLVESLFAEAHPHKEQRLVRNARELTYWMRDRNDALPPGSTIVHHVDSHDSIWWRLPGAQWRRERFGREATVALVAVFALAGGAFMTFMGGEDGIEDELRRAHDLRRRLPEIATGSVQCGAATPSSDDIFAVIRDAPDGRALVAVNLASSAMACDVALDGPGASGDVFDHWNEEWIHGWRWNSNGSLRLDFEPFQPRVVRLSASAAAPEG